HPRPRASPGLCWRRAPRTLGSACAPPPVVTGWRWCSPSTATGLARSEHRPAMTTDMSTDEALVIGVSTAQPVSEGVGPGPGLLDLPQAFAELRSCSEHARPQLRTWLVESQLPLVEQLARGFRDRGEPLDDLVQVGTIGLLKAIDRFDPHRGVDFPTYATPTIVGEIKRHFRDRGWSIRVPRRLQEMRAALRKATAVLSQRFGRSPTISELAGWLEVREETVLEGLESANAYATVSL